MSEKTVNLKIFDALSKAQGEFPEIIKEKINPHFKSKYADIAAVITTIKPVMAKFGLGFTQTIRGGEMVTTLFHSSGEVIETTVPLLLPEKATMQHLGGAITYARRYGLQCAVGVAAEDDDDGNSANGRGNQPPPAQKLPIVEMGKVIAEYASLQEAAKVLADRVKAQRSSDAKGAMLTGNHQILQALKDAGHEAWVERLWALVDEQPKSLGEILDDEIPL